MQVAIFYRDRETHTPLPLSSEPPPPSLSLKWNKTQRGVPTPTQRGVPTPNPTPSLNSPPPENEVCVLHSSSVRTQDSRTFNNFSLLEWINSVGSATLDTV